MFENIYIINYFLLFGGIIISLYASFKVKSTFKKYSKVESMSGMTGFETADKILRMSGITDVRIEPVPGQLTDHYDSKNKVLRLSESVYNKSSIAAIGVAAHECGHAIQDQEDYGPLRIRHSLVPVANIGTMVSMPIIMLGLIMGQVQGLINLGIILFSLTVIFQLVTLPVEFNASRRAVQRLEETGVLHGDELKKSGKVLKAAALTYVAAAAATIMQLLRLVLIFGGGNRND